MSLAKIVYATDLSERADRAGQRAFALAQTHHSTVLALCVIDADLRENKLLHMTGQVGTEIENSLIESHRQRLRQHLDGLGPFAGKDLQSTAMMGPVCRTILSQAQQFGADLIVIGAHGVNHLHDVLVGTTAENLLRHTDRPVLVVKNPTQDTPYQRILVPVDFSQRSRHALSLAQDLQTTGHPVQVLHVFNTAPMDHIYRTGVDEGMIQRIEAQAQREDQQLLQEFIQESGVDTANLQETMKAGYPPLVIEQFAREMQADLLVMGTHGRGRFKDVLLGGVARRVVNQVPCDVLLVRGQD